MPTLGARQDNQAGENEALGFMGDIFNSGRKVYANRLEDLVDEEFATASKTKIPKYDILLDSHQRWKDNRIRTGKSNIRAAGTILGTINPFPGINDRNPTDHPDLAVPMAHFQKGSLRERFRTFYKDKKIILKFIKFQKLLNFMRSIMLYDPLPSVYAHNNMPLGRFSVCPYLTPKMYGTVTKAESPP